MADSLLTYTRIMLRRWAALNRAELPKLAKPAHYGSIGHGTRTSDTYLPPVIELIEVSVNKADPQDRLMLHTEYLRDWPQRQKAKHLGLSVGSYYRRLVSAETYVKHAIDY